MYNLFSRRNFLTSSILAPIVVNNFNTKSLSNPENVENTSFKVVVFSKHLQHLKWEQLAITCKQCGLDGVDLTVRDGGHVKPERVEEDLPKVVEAFKKVELKIIILTTRLLSGKDPFAEPILKTAGALKIPYVRIGYHQYNDNQDIPKTFEMVKDDLLSLKNIAEKYNVILGYHNHSGLNNFGGPMWDLIQVYREINSPYLGSNYDLGHIKAEGFSGAWRTNTLVAIPWIRMIAIKDFVVENHKIKWVPLGTGCVPYKEMLEIICGRGNFRGPISIHLEYETKTEEEKLKYIKDSAIKIREIIKPYNT